MPRHFEGVIGRDWRESTPWWPPEPTPPAGAPNVVLLVLDDVGFAQLGCYGSDIATPTLDGLARNGVQLSNFHTTALCSPTRSCLLTGRNHHRNGMGRVADLAVGYPGYWGIVPRENGMLSEILRSRGYATYAVGKWHLSPEFEIHMGASRATWPLGRGFDRWYGFHGGETHQFVPALYHDNHAIMPPARPEDGYHLSADLADRAIEYVADLRAVDVDRPFFLYFATGACHSPHHAPQEWIARYRGQFDGGWDAWRDATFARQHAAGLLTSGTRLAPRPHWVPAWDELHAEDQTVAARFMECFAAYLSYTDAQIQRVFEFLAKTGDLDNTLVVAVSDNGASAEGGAIGSINDARLINFTPTTRQELRDRIDEIGGPTAHNNYPWGWTMAGNTPFKRWKREVHEGGVADPCIVSWPARVTGRGVRRQFTHAVDVMPTILDLVGIDPPAAIDGREQSHLDGASFAAMLDNADAQPHRLTQHFEMLGSRALYHDGWKAVTFHSLGDMYGDGLDPDAPFDEDVWELYHVADDQSETVDLAADDPDRVKQLVELWWEEAQRNDVLPLNNRPLDAILHPREAVQQERPSYVYYPHTAPVPEHAAVNVRNRTHTITAYIDVPVGCVPHGVLLAIGSVLGGFSLYLRDGRLCYVHNLAGGHRDRLVADEPLMSGRHECTFAFTKTATIAGTCELRVDGKVVASGKIDHFTPMAFSYTGGGLTCGYEVGPAVGDDYTAPFPTNVTIDRVVVQLSGEPYIDAISEFMGIMAEQ
ncbi:MAG TPA: arylsulfatase [Acidimicrobiia bacterium]|nr:arylsulfatase [Acidimicrobiia bacterium]